MAISLDRFRSAIGSRGISMGNRYRVSITGTSSIKGVGTFSEEEMALCTNVNLPSANFNTFALREHMRPMIRIPHDVLFESLSLEFMCFDDGMPYSKFYAWQRAMYGDGMRMQDFNYYAQGKVISVVEENRQGRDIKKFEFVNCWPMNVSKSLSSEHRGAPEKFSVGFMYEYINSGHY